MSSGLRTGFRITGALLLLAVCFAIGQVQSQERESDVSDGLAAALVLERAFVDAIANAEDAVVSIARHRQMPNQPGNGRRRGFRFRRLNPEPPEPESPDFIPNDFGSGVVIGELPGQKGKTAILTNYHVVKGGRTSVDPDNADHNLKLWVRLPDRRQKEATIWSADPRSDLAVIMIEATGLKHITMGDGSKVRKGQFVLALGNPYAAANDGGSTSASWGIISNIARRANPEVANPDGSVEERLHHLGGLLQTDARLNLGMSGGALINLKGELIGITTSLAALAGYEKSAGYAIPLDQLTQRVVNTLLAGYEVEYGFLGVSLKSSNAQVFPFPNSPAAKGGVMDRDVVTSVNGRRVVTRTDLVREVGSLSPGELAKLIVNRVVNRDRRLIELEVTLGKWPAVEEQDIVAPRKRYGPWRGLVVDYCTARKRDMASTEYPLAVLVAEVIPNSSAYVAGLRRGDFISHVRGRPVTSPKEFHEAVRDVRSDITVALWGGEAREVVIRSR